MRIFITGTDTHVGKTLVSSWICVHTGFDYYKPIQTGSIEGTDSATVTALSNSTIHPEAYLYQAPLAPCYAAQCEQKAIMLEHIVLPNASRMIVEGAGGLFVPLTDRHLMIDWIHVLALPVLLVARSQLGTINHTLLSLEALKHRGIKVLGVIVTGEPNQMNCDAIEYYGKTEVLAQLPFLPEITTQTLRDVPLPHRLRHIFRGSL